MSSVLGQVTKETMQLAHLDQSIDQESYRSEVFVHLHEHVELYYCRAGL
jgi:hypothetical protein